MSERVEPYGATRGASAHGLCVVGIDPGDTTGVSVWDVDAQRLVACVGVGFFDALQLLSERAWSVGDDYDEGTRGPWWPVGLVVVEDNRRLPIYARHDRVRGRERDRLCRNVGRIDRDVELWATWCTREGYAVRLAEPLRGGKWDAAKLRAVTGWEAPTNEHGRDAARLVVGTNRRHVERWGKASAEGTPPEVVS